MGPTGRNCRAGDGGTAPGVRGGRWRRARQPVADDRDDRDNTARDIGPRARAAHALHPHRARTGRPLAGRQGLDRQPPRVPHDAPVRPHRTPVDGLLRVAEQARRRDDPGRGADRRQHRRNPGDPHRPAGRLDDGAWLLGGLRPAHQRSLDLVGTVRAVLHAARGDPPHLQLAHARSAGAAELLAVADLVQRRRGAHLGAAGLPAAGLPGGAHGADRHPPGAHAARRAARRAGSPTGTPRTPRRFAAGRPRGCSSRC